ncbi:hypothetical protein M7784_04200 [Desulfovibrio aminophilus]|nr:hypothetical protein [Desulfovibrio aminophilus]MCM0754445.1 hypothetical protein [Desulfovibrio aminophilus]
MAQLTEGKKPVVKTIIYGVLSVALYAAAFSQANTLTALFSRGSFWAAGPIATVFLFSYIHGAFASNLWSCLGVVARPRATQRPATRPQPRATLNA